MKKLLSKLFLAVFLFSGIISTARAQSGVHPVAAGKFDVRFTVKSTDCSVSPRTLTIAVQVRATSMADTFLMGDANYRFRFKTTQLRLLGVSPTFAPSLVSQENYSAKAPSSDTNYGFQNLNGSGEGPTEGIVSLNTFYSGSNQGAKLVKPVWSTVACIKFNVVNGNDCFDLVWDDDKTFPVTGMNEVYNILTDPVFDYKQDNVKAGGYFGNISSCLNTYCLPILAVNDINTTLLNTAVSGQVLTNDIGSGLVVTTTPIANTIHASVTLNANGTYTYTPTTGYSGTDTFKYKVCDNLTPQKCDTALVTIIILPAPSLSGINSSPVALPDVAQTNVGTPVMGNLLSNDFDPNTGQTLTVTTTPVTPPTNGMIIILLNGTYTYTPNPGFSGQDIFMYQVCDSNTPKACVASTVTVDVVVDNNPITANDKPIAGDEAGITLKNTALIGTLSGNDTDPNTGQILAYTTTPITAPAHGTVTITPTGGYTYTPTIGYIGPDAFTYKVCDNGSPVLCTTATAYLTVVDQVCVTFDFKVILQGPYNSSTGLMGTVLNQRGLLPGQIPIGTYATPTPGGQPYNVLPFNYAGSESITAYPATVVDWVLVTLRTDSTKASKVISVAGLLHSDGHISFVNPCFNLPTGSYYVVIEHRNHMGVMSHIKVPVSASKITYDFTIQQSYQLTNPPSFGQKQVGIKFVMYAADGSKANVNDNYDINFKDSQLWKTLSGNFDIYLLSDFNLDADSNFMDNSLWKTNSGSYSGVLH